MALDEWWAYYAGSLEDGTAANGYGPYILAEKHSKAFGTGGRKMGNGGVSSVNAILLAGTKEIKSLMGAAGNDLKINDIIKCMRAQIKVPIIQGCIEYAYKTDPTTKYPGDSTNPGRKAEMWAFCAGVLPFLYEVNPADAKVLRAETDIVPIDTKDPSFTKIKGVFLAGNLNKMGVSCKDIGGFVPGVASTSATTVGSDFAECTDTASIANAHADTTKCIGAWNDASPATSDANHHTASALSMAASFIIMSSAVLMSTA